MLIINADDWGRTKTVTSAALACFKNGRITSVSAMVFMRDSERAADVARDAGLDVGLHLNLNHPFTGRTPASFILHADRVARFMLLNKYAFLFYNPLLKRDFEVACRTQIEEFVRLYRREPSHINGHQHLHLSMNVLVNRLLPAGSKVRRNHSFNRAEKNLANRAYRAMIDNWLGTRYRLSDFFFDICPFANIERIVGICGLSDKWVVELMTHPDNPDQHRFLNSHEFGELLACRMLGTFSKI